MNEIERIRDLRADLPGVRTVKREAARAQLLERIEAAGRSPRRGVSLRPQRRGKLILAGIAALGLIGAASVLLLGGTGAGVQSAAARSLNQAATIAAVRRFDVPKQGQYLVSRSKTGYLEYSMREGPRVAARLDREFKHVLHTRRGMAVPSWWYFVTSRQKTWMRANGSGWTKTVSGKTSFLSARQRAAWASAGRPRLPKAGRVSVTRLEPFATHNGSIWDLSFSQLKRLPTEPARLKSWIEAHESHTALSTAGTTSTGLPSVSSGDATTFGAIAALLQQSAAPPALRAALYRVAAQLPGVRLLGPVADPVGRRGVGVAYDDPQHGQRLELIFDPTTSTLLGQRWVVTSSKRSGIAVPPGTVVGYTAQLGSHIVK